ncbi:MAG TPA: glycerol-3-phosphate dehydrogenase/oxidase [Chitinophagaceae bacterium]|nr:glycerol-3-phosphate dehydrogenase/oxidase [Chitinophagaceae bacterium]
MNRAAMVDQMNAQAGSWDICIIGGGATGLGAAIDAASRGYSTILFEQTDFAKGTSSRSTKLVHGGVRYLQQGNIKLVMDALKERGTLKKNAPHLVKNQSFIVPNYKWWEGPYYGLGLKVYDWMSGNLGLGPSEWLSKEEVLERAPTLDPTDLRGGVLYHDGQFDDARLAINMAQTAAAYGGCLLNYCGVTGFIKTDGKITGVQVKDQLSGKEHEIRCRAVINATGVFSDALQHMDDAAKTKTISPSQGIHIVLDASFLPGNSAIMIPHTDDGRVLFAVPWHKKVIVGTTDTPIKKIYEEPVAQAEEIDFIIQHIGRYLTKDPGIADVKSIFAGLRPLVKAESKKTAELSRDHVITIAPSGLINILGGKWTTYRKMAEDVVNTAAINAMLPHKDCCTESLAIHGAQPTDNYDNDYYYYGSDQPAVRAMEESDASLAQKIHPQLPYTFAAIAWAVKEEMCITVDDALARRTRAILLDAKAALAAAPAVAALMARLLQKDSQWETEQLAAFKKIALHYIPLANH